MESKTREEATALLSELRIAARVLRDCLPVADWREIVRAIRTSLSTEEFSPADLVQNLLVLLEPWPALRDNFASHIPRPLGGTAANASARRYRGTFRGGTVRSGLQRPSPSWAETREGLEAVIRDFLGDVIPATPAVCTAPDFHVPGEVQLGERFLATVRLRAPGSDSGGFPVPLDARGEAQVRVDMRASGGIEVEQPGSAVLVIDAAGRSAEVSFGVRPLALGPAALVFFFTAGAVPLGKQEFSLEVVRPGLRREVPRGPAGPLLFVPGPAAALPSFMLVVERVPLVENRLWSWGFCAGSGCAGFVRARTPSPSVGDLAAKLAESFKRSDIEALDRLATRGEAGRKDAEHRLLSIGSRLAEAVLDPEIHKHLARLPEGALLTVVSDSLWVPWELLAIRHATAGEVFLGEHFALSRWSFSAPPPAGGSFAPRLGPLLLAHDAAISAGEERLALGSAFHRPPDVTTDREALLDSLRGAAHAVVHIKAHGRHDAGAAHRSGVYLGAAQEPVRADDLPRPTRAGDPQPLGGLFLFIAACRAGAESEGLVDLDGLVQGLVKAGVSAILAASIPVGADESAAFATRFYRASMSSQRMMLAEAARQARKMSRQAANAMGTISFHELAFGLVAAPGVGFELAEHEVEV